MDFPLSKSPKTAASLPIYFTYSNKYPIKFFPQRVCKIKKITKAGPPKKESIISQELGKTVDIHKW